MFDRTDRCERRLAVLSYPAYAPAEVVSAEVTLEHLRMGDTLVVTQPDRSLQPGHLGYALIVG